MRDSYLPGTELLKTVLEPLLEDFDYWFTHTRELVETEQLSFMSDQEQSEFVLRLKKAQAELSTVRGLFTATKQQVGVDMATLKPWHHLVTECWSLMMRSRQEKEI